MNVQNLISRISPDDNPERTLDDIKYVVCHRVGWTDIEEWNRRGYTMDVFGVRDFYRREVGSSIPYHFVVLPGGRIQQAARIFSVTPHVKRYNSESIGVGFLGDFRHLPPEKHQRMAGLDLVSMLCQWGPKLQVVGHTELGPNATSTPKKKCPGSLFVISRFRSDVEMLNYEYGARHLTREGIEI